MDETTILREIRDRVWVLTLNRPGAANRLNNELLETLAGHLDQAAADPACATVVLTAAGDVFCGGGELGDYRGQSAMEIRRFGESFIKLHAAIVRSAKPVVAAVQGDALGGGLSLVEACDLAVASEEASFGVPEIKAGLAPMMALTGARRIRSRKGCLEMALLGESVSAARAQEIGLVNWVCPRSKVLDMAFTIAGRLAVSNPTAMALCKKLYAQGDALPYEHQLEAGLDTLVALLKSEDAAEALTAGAEGRAPVWKAR